MFSRNKSKHRVVIRSSPETHEERINKSRKKKHSLVHEFDILFTKINNVREWTKNLIRDSIALVSTESDMDIKSYLNDSERKHLGKTKLENLGMDMIHAAKSSGGGIYEKALLKVGECEMRLGTYAREFAVDICSSFIRPLKYFMEVELNKLLEEKEMLTSRKIDYDYHVRQASNGRADKTTHHKMKMAEMALEFQYIHAKEILLGIEASECQVGHLSDLVSVQSVYHQKCLAELEKLKSELGRMSSNVPAEKTKESSVLDPTTKMSSSKPKKRVEEPCPPEIRAVCLNKLENFHDAPDDPKFLETRFSQECFSNAIQAKEEKSPIDSDETDGKEVQAKRSISGGSKSRPSNAHELKCPQKARSSLLPFVHSKRTRLGKIPEDPRSRPSNAASPQECFKHQPTSVHSTLKGRHKSPSNGSCHHYSGDHSRGSTANKDGYTSDDSTASKETHVIPIPIRSNYRRDVGKMFFTPCKDLD